LTTNTLSESHENYTNVEEISVLLENTDFLELEKEYQNLPFALLRKAGIIQAKRAIQDSLTPDKNLIQVIEALDEAHSNFNLSSERFTTWYSQLHGRPRAKLEDILSNEDLPSQMHSLKNHIENTKKLIKDFSSYLDTNSPKIFPNLVNVVGTQLAVRIVSLAGDLSKLARMPASTIQLLGAEKALFRHMADGSPPPKHGILYQHPTIKRATGKEKGRFSRKLAAKVAIASKIDYFGEKSE
jgi:nucleolar protein 56